VKKTGVCHIISPMRLYGKEKWLLAFMKYLDRDRFRPSVVMLTRARDTALAAELGRLNIPAYTVRTKGKFSREPVQRITSLIKKENIEIVHSHDYKADLAALLACRKAGIRSISTPHGWNRSWDIKLRLYQWLDQVVLRYFDRVVPLSPSLYSSLRLVSKENRMLISNFIDTGSLPGGGRRDSQAVCFIGRLIPLKRVGDLITALSMVENKEITLRIIGDGPLRLQLEELAGKLGLSSRVRFLGFREDALELLAESSILVLPSVTEGMPRTVMEAMAMGKPVIGSNIPGLKPLIEDGKTGMLVKVKSPPDIARAINRLTGDPSLYEDIASAARELIMRKHDARKAVEKYQELYLECLSGN